jgi:hypothetical protein
MTPRECYYFSKAKHKYYAKKRKKEKSLKMPPNLRRQLDAEVKPDTLGYTGTTRLG